MTVTKISLVDQHQDFTEWYVRNDIVIDCQPHQGKVWVGTKIVYPEGPLKVGDTLHIISGLSQAVTTLNHPIESIEELSDEESLKVEGYGRKWAEIKGIPAAVLGL